MTLDNLQYALYLNNRIILDKIKTLKNAIDGVVSTDIEELKKLIDDINSSELVNVKQLITDLDTNLSNHVNNTVVHVTQNDKDLWNATLQNAKDYAKQLFDGVTSFTIEIVESLPTENIKTMTIYFMRNGRDNESDYYEEYMYINDKWEIIGSTFVNLSPYLLKEEFEKYQQEITDKFTKYNTSEEINNILKDYLLVQTFDDTIKNYTTTKELNKILEEYTKTKDIHTHDNKTVIDKLSESVDGTLLFDGQEIKGGSGITISKEDNNAIQQKTDGIFVEDKSEQIDNIQKQVNKVSIAQKTINGITDYYFIGGMNPTNTNTLSIPSNTSFIYSLKQILSYEDNTGLKISDDGYVTLTEGSWDLTCGTLNAGNNSILFSWRDRNGNVYGNLGFVPKGEENDYDLDSNVVITVNPGEILEIAPICGNDITIEPFCTFVKIIKISTREIDPIEYVNTDNGIEDTPVGYITHYIGNNAPKHYLICNGAEYNITDYPYLTQYFMNEFGSINYFGGNGINTFAVPNKTAMSLIFKSNPTMTSNTTPKGEVIYNNIWDNFKAYTIFGESNSLIESECYSTNKKPSYVGYKFENPTIVNAYSIQPRGYIDVNTISGAPTTWELQASNDITNWITLDSQSGITWSSANDIKLFHFNNSTAYQAYRLYLTGSNDSFMIIGNLKLGVLVKKIYCIKYEPTYFMNYTQTISLEEADAIKKQNELLKQKNALLEQEIIQLGSIIDSINKEVV